MPDTGQRSPTTSTGQTYLPARAYDGNIGTFGYAWNIGGTRTFTFTGFDGDDLPAGATVNGVKIYNNLRHFIFYSYEAATISSVKLSLNGGSAYSSNILSSNQDLSASVVEYTFGGDSEDWGLNWSGFTDISDLEVEFITEPADGSGNHYIWTYEVYAQVYYTEGGASGTITTGPFNIQAGAKVHISSGKLTIK